ncbi:hypothetical protein PGT21_028875 [Puccinia graminis f. sp. tritici]|uniref:Uncharacterized protein n=1 Tax=Puccinia graminis f. sp. tritici TaxID=56615 RepID=A0A5B0NZQ1_PUCGR|nr:hypothetical protein PGT21_028875 [Puccinia graminis f. sp. tritici]
MGTPESQLRLRKTDQNPSADQNSLSSSSNPGRGPIGSDYKDEHHSSCHLGNRRH